MSEQSGEYEVNREVWITWPVKVLYSHSNGDVATAAAVSNHNDWLDIFRLILRLESFPNESEWAMRMLKKKIDTNFSISSTQTSVWTKLRSPNFGFFPLLEFGQNIIFFLYSNNVIDCKISQILLTSCLESGSKSNKKTYLEAWNRKKNCSVMIYSYYREDEEWKDEEREDEEWEDEEWEDERIEQEMLEERKKVDGWSDLMKESFSENCILSSSSLWSFLFSLFDVDEPTKHPTSSPSFLHEFFFFVSHEPFSMLKTETCLTVTR